MPKTETDIEKREPTMSRLSEGRRKSLMQM